MRKILDKICSIVILTAFVTTQILVQAPEVFAQEDCSYKIESCEFGMSGMSQEVFAQRNQRISSLIEGKNDIENNTLSGNSTVTQGQQKDSLVRYSDGTKRYFNEYNQMLVYIYADGRQDQYTYVGYYV